MDVGNRTSFNIHWTYVKKVNSSACDRSLALANLYLDTLQPVSL